MKRAADEYSKRLLDAAQSLPIPTKPARTGSRPAGKLAQA